MTLRSIGELLLWIGLAHYGLLIVSFRHRIGTGARVDPDQAPRPAPGM